MSHKLVINVFYGAKKQQLCIHLVWKSVCTHLASCSFMFFFKLETIKNI